MARARAASTADAVSAAPWPAMSYLITTTTLQARGDGALAARTLVRGLVDEAEHLRCTCLPTRGCECAAGRAAALPAAALEGLQEYLLLAVAGNVTDLRVRVRRPPRASLVMVTGCRFGWDGPQHFAGLWSTARRDNAVFCDDRAACATPFSELFCHAAQRFALPRAAFRPPLVTFSAKVSSTEQQLLLTCQTYGAYPAADSMAIVASVAADEVPPELLRDGNSGCEFTTCTAPDGTWHARAQCLRPRASTAVCRVRYGPITTSAYTTDSAVPVLRVREPEPRANVSVVLALHSEFADTGAALQVFFEARVAGTPVATCSCVDRAECACSPFAGAWNATTVRLLLAASVRDLARNAHTAQRELARHAGPARLQTYVDCAADGARGVAWHFNPALRSVRRCARADAREGSDRDVDPAGCERAYFDACALLPRERAPAVHPLVQFSRYPGDKGMVYVCSAYGFYPAAISVEVMVNGSCSGDAGVVAYWCRGMAPVPNADGTFFTRTWCTVLDTDAVMLCAAVHESGTESLQFPCEGPRRPRAGWWLSAVKSALPVLAALAVLGLSLVWLMRS
ncbi:hypothetical protein EMCLV036L [Equine molluscum contagiosum-like virus]|nr:hypothetical protein EMCLV036L [Equine molluscum contagiosum-like virus]